MLKTKIDKIWVQMFNPTPPGEGDIKNELIEKIVGELKLQNMNFWPHKNSTKSKRGALFLKKMSKLQNFLWAELM